MRDRAHRPFRLADFPGLLGKVGKLARIDAVLPLGARVEEAAAARVEPLVQLGEEFERGFAQDLVRAADAGRFGNDARTVEHSGGLCGHCSTGSTQIE